MNTMGVFIRCAILLAVMQFPVKAQAPMVAVPVTETPVKNNMCPVEEKFNVTRLMPAVHPGETSLCASVPRLCPKDVFDKYTQVLIEEETVVVEKCCPGFVRSDTMECVEIQENQVDNFKSDYLHQGITDIYPQIMLAKIVKAFAEEYGYKESQLNLEDVVYAPLPSWYATRGQEQVGDTLKDSSQEGVQSEKDKPEENATPSASVMRCVIILALRLIGVGLSVIMVFLNIFLFIMAFKACCTRYDEDIISELEEIAMRSSKCVSWEEKLPEVKSGNKAVRANTRTFQSMTRKGRWLARDEYTKPARKIMSLTEIKNVIMEVLASFAKSKETQLAITDGHQLELGNVPQEQVISADLNTFMRPGKASKSTITDTLYWDGEKFTNEHGVSAELQTFRIPDSVALDVDINGISPCDVVFEGFAYFPEDDDEDDDVTDYVEDSDVEDDEESDGEDDEESDGEDPDGLEEIIIIDEEDEQVRPEGDPKLAFVEFVSE